MTNTVDVLFLVSYFLYEMGKISTYLVTSVTDSVVTRVAARSKQSLSNRFENGIFDCWGKAVLWVMAMLVVNMAGNAEIIIVTSSASNKAFLGKF